MGATEGYVTVEESVRLFFRKVGNGPRTLIVLNGFYLFDDFKHLAEGRTIIFLDLRNRGRSNYITDESRLTRGVLNDVDDIETVRQYFGGHQIDLLGHSYAGKTAILYAVKYASHISRIVSIGPMKPDETTQYPSHLTYVDSTLPEFFDKAAQLQQQRQSLDPQEFCRRFVSLLRVIYVADPADAGKIRLDFCDLPTELNVMAYWLYHLLPSIQSSQLNAKDLSEVRMPVLIVHGAKDRSSPYGGAREWAIKLPNARLLSVENAAHVPWIEAPGIVFGAIRTFLDGAWPETAQQAESL